MSYSSTFDITHKVADLVQKVMDNYKGPYKFEKITDEDVSRASAVIYGSGIVNVIIMRNPNSTASCQSKSKRSYARITISAPKDRVALESFYSQLLLQVPELRKNHRINAYNSAKHIAPLEKIAVNE